MSDAAGLKPQRIDAFFSTPAARADRWPDLVDAAKAWAAGTGNRAVFDAALNEAAAVEEFHGYPGPQLMTARKLVHPDALTKLTRNKAADRR
jgi:arginine decarboxylase